MRPNFGISSEWTTNSCDTVDAINTAVARLITRHLRIPKECLSLVWSKPQDHHVVVTIVLTPLSDGVLHDWAMQTSPCGGGEAALVWCAVIHAMTQMTILIPRPGNAIAWNAIHATSVTGAV